MVITHLATGHEIPMGWVTSDPAKAGKTENGEVALAREYNADFAFTEIENSTCKEPLLHHGYGFDIFCN